ncbi:hypothetical protein LTR49_028337 [Elasticomyces elasticus]|nr:hypothetical protein LTR49_028337 [Elasticomyces elasticus]
MYICYGRTRMLYQERSFSLLCKAIQAHSGAPSRALNRLERILYDYKLEEPKSLLEAAQMTKDAAAGDPRDKVYALLGIVPQAAIDRIVPDYTLSTWQVYAQATFESMIASNSLDSLALTTASPTPQPGLEGYVLPGWDEADVEDDEEDDAELRWPGRAPATPSHDMRQLRVQGITFAAVSSLYHCPSVPTNIKDDDSITAQYGENATLMRPSEHDLRTLLQIAKLQLAGQKTVIGYNYMAYLADSYATDITPVDLPLAALRRKEGSTVSAEDIISPWFESWSRDVNMRNAKDNKDLDCKTGAHGARTSAVAFVGYSQIRGVLHCFAV